jgi:molybdate transport system substrate-binding protein
MLWWAALACDGSGRAHPTQIQAAVAANFAATADRLGLAYTAASGVTVKVALGSSGQLYAQIVAGAPFDVFLSADTVRPARLVSDGLAVAGSRFTYAVGRLALYGPGLSPVVDGPGLLRSTRYRHLAIANPATAPYGVAAEETMRRLGILELARERIVRGEHIGQAYEFVRSGGAELGLVGLSQVVREPPATFWIVPDSLHGTIRQDAVLLRRGRDHLGARGFLDFVRGPVASSIIVQDGYGMPE